MLSAGVSSQDLVAALAPSLKSGLGTRENVSQHVHDCFYVALDEFKSIEPRAK